MIQGCKKSINAAARGKKLCWELFYG